MLFAIPITLENETLIRAINNGVIPEKVNEDDLFMWDTHGRCKVVDDETLCAKYIVKTVLPWGMIVTHRLNGERCYTGWGLIGAEAFHQCCLSYGHGGDCECSCGATSHDVSIHLKVDLSL